VDPRKEYDINASKGDKSGSSTASGCESVIFETENATAARIGIAGNMAGRMQSAMQRKPEATHIQPNQFLPPRPAATPLAIAVEVTASAKGSDESLFSRARVPVLRKIAANVMTAIHQRAIVISIISHRDTAIRSNAAKFKNCVSSSGGLPVNLAPTA
jgi:hypothetical protein